MQVFTPQEFVDYINKQWKTDPDPTLPGSKLVERLMGPHKNLERFTRTGQGEVFALHTLNEQVKQGVSLKRTGDNRWTFCTYTLDQGRHVLSFEAQVDRDGGNAGQLLWFRHADHARPGVCHAVLEVVAGAGSIRVLG